LNLSGIVGLCVFTQYWYWYPLIHFLSMSFAPTTMIGLNGDLKTPNWSFASNAPPSRFAYPEPYKAPAAAAPTSVKTAVLSTAKKARQRAAQKAVDKQGEKDKEVKEKEPAKEPAKEPVKEPEPDTEVLHNPARVTHSQLQVISFLQGTRWMPVDMARCKTGGIIVLRDTKPSEPLQLAGESDSASSTSPAQLPTTTPVPPTFGTAERADLPPPPGGVNDLPEDFELQEDDF